MKVSVELPKEVVEAIEDVIKNSDLYLSIDEFVEEAVCREINRLIELGLCPVRLLLLWRGGDLLRR